MFKLESYITPWLLSYIDQYVKLRREDFQLSLWGGDVVFNNLELRLANIQKLVPTLPIIFQSGLIHELRIHIPWIRINSEPIVVTLNQIELVIVLNKERLPTNDSSSSLQNDIPPDSVLLQQQQPTTAEQSNYVQTVLARILNNVQIVVNNLIVKFIEDDVVISLSSRTAQCFAANQQWLKSFVELTTQDLSLRRLITLPDLTLCLDRRDSDGKVHRYEVPLLSRCSFECRIQMFYTNVYQQLSTKPIQTRLTFNCANIEVSIVDNQLSMIRRLTERIMLLVNYPNQVDLNDSVYHEQNTSKESNVSVPSVRSISPSASATLPLQPSPSNESTTSTEKNQVGWASWAWSYVPSVTNLFAEDDPTPQEIDSPEPAIELSPLINEQNSLVLSQHNNQSPTPILLAGIDIDRISLQYKVTKFNDDKPTLVPFIGFLVEKANIIVERYKLTSTTASDGQPIVSRVRKVKVSTSKVSLMWDERLGLSLSDVHFTLHYDGDVRMTRFTLMINDFNVRDQNELIIYPCQATLKLDHLQTYSLLHLDFSSLTFQMNFNLLAYLINFINQIRMIVDIVISILEPSTWIGPLEDDRIFVDDLRSGAMKYLCQETDSYPNANEITFTTISSQHFTSAMTWKYPQRRSILKCHILPLPFDDDLGGIVVSHRRKMVECLMQYWHFGTKQFVTWQTFDLIDGQPLFLDFSDKLAENPYSEMWRIVLINASSIINQAASLAASTRIDSLQSQRYEPSIEMAVTIPNIRLHLMIQPDHVSSSSKFKSILAGCKHDVLTMNLDNLSLDFSQRFDTKLICLETSLSLEVLEYRFLTKRSCIEPSLINMDLLIDTSKSSLSSTTNSIFDDHNEKYSHIFRSAKNSLIFQLHFDIDHINIRLSQSLSHLINVIHHDFFRSDMRKILGISTEIDRNDPFYYTYYLFSNHLNCSIGLKQNNSTDNFYIVQPNEMTDFVWSKLNSDEISLQFSLENLSNDPFYSSSIDVHQPFDETKRKLTVQFDNSPHVFYLEIDQDQHQIRRHIHLFGRFLIKNLCQLDLRLKIDLRIGSRSLEFFLGKNDDQYLSCLQTLDDIEFVQWNSSRKYSIDELNPDGIISNSEQNSLWIHLFQSNEFTYLIFAPIIVYRSFLSQTVQLHLNDDRAVPLESKGVHTFFDELRFDEKNEKYSHRLQQIDADRWTETIFELRQQSYLTVESRNSTTENENLNSIDSLKTLRAFRSSKTSNLVDLLHEENSKTKSNDEDFPAPLNEIESDSNSFKENFVPTMSSIDCRIESIRFHPNLNTVLLQLKPLTLIDNRTPFFFHFYANLGRDRIYVDANNFTGLSKLEFSQLQFVLIDPHDGEHIQCQTVDLILRPIAMINPNTIIHSRLYYKKSIDLYFIKSSNNDYFLFRLQHDYIDQTHFLTIQSKYVLVNRTTHPLALTILPISQQQYAIDYPYLQYELLPNESTSICRFQAIPSTDVHYYFLFQRTGQDRNHSNSISKPIRLLTNVDESGNRQCFCLFQRDSLLKPETNKSILTHFDGSHQSFRGDLYSVHQLIRSTTNQIEISVQSNPSWAFVQVVNSCPCPLLCRVENLSSNPHIIPGFSSIFIGIDSSEISPNAEQILHNARFYLARYQFQDSLISTILNYFQQITSETIQWSRPMRIDAQLSDVFLPIPGLHDVLIRSSPFPIDASRTLIVEPVHRQHASKIMTASKSSPNISDNSFTFPSTTIITETVPRHYRSSFSDKNLSKGHSVATQHYLRAFHQRFLNAQHFQLQLNISIAKISFSLLDELTNICLFPEILRLTVDKSQIVYHERRLFTEPTLSQRLCFVSIDQLQIDNQSYSPRNHFDFPVVLMSKDGKTIPVQRPLPIESTSRADSIPSGSSHQRQHSSSSIDTNTTTTTDDFTPAFDSLSHNHRASRSRPIEINQKQFLTVQFHQINQRFIHFHFHLQPFEVYLEDQFIYLLLKIFSELLPLDLRIETHRDENEKEQPDTDEHRLVKVPFVCDAFHIGPVNTVVSVHASMTVYIGCNQLPVFVDKFEKNLLYATKKQLLALITRHYFLSLLTRSPLLIGSFDLIGNPSVFIRNVTDGIYDLFHLPYVGMRRGPSGFMFGISQGATSLLRHVSLGTLTSLTSFANSVARNMDRLAMDDEHSTRNEETCRQIPTRMTTGLLQGLELFGLSVLGAIAGLAEQPMSSFRNRPESQPATSTVLSGVGKGLVGIVVKPVGGVAQLISQTGQGILYGTGLLNIPNRRHRQIEQDARINTTSSLLKLKRSCQLMIDDDEIVDALDYVIDHHPIEHGMLILTKKGHFIIYHKDDENPHSQYLLSHVELSPSSESTALLQFNSLSFYVDSRLRHQFLALCRFLRQ